MSGDDLPRYEDLMLPVLTLIGQGHERADTTLPILQRQFSLTDEQMERLVPSGSKTYVLDRVIWARTYMMKAGLIERVERAKYALTPAGRDVLARNPSKLDNRDLASFTAFQNWRLGQEKPGEDTTLSQVSEQPAADETPEELIDRAYLQLDSALVDELLEQVLSLTPARFERLIVELLLAMGYGDGRAEMGQAIGKSGDGGIDGVVNEDKLGLDAVYIQAKRYAPDNTIGRPALQAFVGSMTGESATKGVFVTTSSFSKEARDYIRRVQQRVVLIDGRRLARLMIDHGVGVVVEKTYVLRSIDANFFDPI